MIKVCYDLKRACHDKGCCHMCHAYGRCYDTCDKNPDECQLCIEEDE